MSKQNRLAFSSHAIIKHGKRFHVKAFKETGKNGVYEVMKKEKIIYEEHSQAYNWESTRGICETLNSWSEETWYVPSLRKKSNRGMEMPNMQKLNNISEVRLKVWYLYGASECEHIPTVRWLVDDI